MTAAIALLAMGPVATSAQDRCAAGKTTAPDVLTIATGNPAYFPWVLDDNPASGDGFEAAVAYAVAEEMDFARECVNEAISALSSNGRLA